MVDESLVAHVKRIVGEDIEPEFRRLLNTNVYIKRDDLTGIGPGSFWL